MSLNFGPLHLGAIGRGILNYAVKNESLRKVGFAGRIAHTITGGKFTPGLSREIFYLSQAINHGETVQIRDDGFYKDGIKIAGNPFISRRYTKFAYSDLNFGKLGYSEFITRLRKDPSQVLSRETTLNGLLERANTQVKSNWQKHIREIIADSIKSNLSEKERAEVAKALASVHPVYLSMSIKDFDIKDEQLLIEIAFIATPTKHFKDFGINSFEAKIAILRAAARKSIWGAADYLENFGLTDTELLDNAPDVILMLARSKRCSEKYEAAILNIKAKFGYASNLLDQLEKIRSSGKANSFTACAHWVGSIIATLETSEDNLGLIRAFLVNQDYFGSLLHFYDPGLRKEYTEHLTANMLRKLTLPVSEIFSYKRHENLAGAMLIPIFDGCDDDKHIYGQLKNIFKTPLLKDTRKQMHLIKAILVITRNKILSLEEKRNILRIALGSDRPTHYISFARELIALGKAKELREVKNVGDIKALLDHEFEVMFDFGDPDVIVAEAICNFKEIRMLEILSKRLKRIGLAYWKLYCKWIKSIVTGNYPNIRYMEDRTHLNIVFKGEEDPKETEWRKGEIVTIRSLKSGIADKSTIKSGNTLWQNENWYVEDTDDAETALRCGTDVDQSCLKIDGKSQFIPALLSILLDGKIRLLVLRDSEGNMIGRSLMRVLYDEQNQMPVLFVDQPYIVNSYDKKEIVEIFLEMSKRRAKRLGMPLTWSIEGKNSYPKYQSVLISYGGPVDNEVIDAIGGAKVTNKYEIPVNFVELIQE